MDEIEKIKLKMLKEMMNYSRNQNPSNDNPILQLTDQNFSSEIQRNPRLVVDFWADWCAPCRMMAPIIERLARKMAGKVKFAKLNVDENPVTANSYSVMAIPTLILFKEGKMADRIIGLKPEYELEKRIIEVLSE